MTTTGWRKRRLGDLLEIKHGYAFKGEFFSDKGEYILLTPGNCPSRAITVSTPGSWLASGDSSEYT